MAEFDDITRLGAIDDAIRAEERAIERAEQRLAVEQAAVAQASAVLAAVEESQRSTRAEERADEARLAQYGKQLQAALRSLETGVGDPEVAERQRLKSLDLIDDTETRLLELIERQEHLVTEHQVASDALRAASERHDGVEEQVKSEISERQARLGGFRTEREGASTALDAALLNRYTLLLHKKGSAVTTLDQDRCCTKCRMLVAAQQLAEARKKRLVTCRGCARWITL